MTSSVVFKHTKINSKIGAVDDSSVYMVLLRVHALVLQIIYLKIVENSTYLFVFKLNSLRFWVGTVFQLRAVLTKAAASSIP